MGGTQPGRTRAVRIGTPADLGALVREARERREWTQTALGTRIGASRFWVAQFERGKPGAELGLALRAVSAVGLRLVAAEPASGRVETPAAAARSTRDTRLGETSAATPGASSHRRPDEAARMEAVPPRGRRSTPAAPPRDGEFRGARPRSRATAAPQSSASSADAGRGTVVDLDDIVGTTVARLVAAPSVLPAPPRSAAPTPKTASVGRTTVGTDPSSTQSGGAAPDAARSTRSRSRRQSTRQDG